MRTPTKSPPDLQCIINTAVPRSRLTTAINTGPSYWRPIWTAVRDAGVGLCIIPQGGQPFDLPTNRPTILVIGDDMFESKGPQAFLYESLCRFVRRCRRAVIVASEPIPSAYASAAEAAAGLRQDVIIVETRPEHEADWKNTLDVINPDLAYLLCLVKPAGGVQ
jgi:hypothetical protein